MDDIRRWLTARGLEKYIEVFDQAEVDWAVLPHLDTADLKELGLPLGARKKVLHGIAELAQSEGQNDTAGHDEERQARVAENRQLTVMFCDLADSTALSETLDAEDYRDLINFFQASATHAIKANGGYVARYMGDGMLAYFGYPAAAEDDPIRATKAGLAAIKSVQSRGDVAPLHIRIGVATGPVLVGDIIGEGASEEAAVVGATANLAARLQGAAELDTVVISAGTNELLKGQMETRQLGSLTLKGFSEPVIAYRALRSRSLAEVDASIRDATPLIGRDVEIALLQRAWDAVVQNECQAVLLRGDAGLGKSRLVRAFKATVARGQRSSVQWHCSSLYQSTANFPAREQLRHLVRVDGTNHGEALTRLRSLLTELQLPVETMVPVLARLVGVLPSGMDDTLAPDRLKQETVRAQIELLVALSALRPVLFIVEDLHWADPTTLEVLHRMIVACKDRPVMFLMTARTEFEPTWDPESHAQMHRLHNLSRRDTTRFVHNLIGDQSLPDTAIAQIIQRADGVPLFVEEVTKHLLAAKGDMAVPSSLRDSLTARLDRLGASKDVAQAAAVIGRSFTLDALHALVDKPRDALATAIGQFQAEQLIHARVDGSYEFRHALFRDAAYDSLLRNVRRRLHGDYVRYLNTLDDQNAPPELTARHLQEAGDTLAAVHAWERAGDQSNEESAQAEATRQYQSAIDLHATLTDTERNDKYELGVLLKLGQAQFGAVGGAAPETAATFRRVHALVEKVGSLEEKFRAFHGEQVAFTISGQTERGLTNATEFVELARRLQVDWAIGCALRMLSTSQTMMGDLDGARTSLTEVLTLKSAMKRGPQGFGHDPAVTAESNLSHVEWAMGLTDTARQRSDDNLTQLDTTGVNPNTVAHTLVWRMLLGIYCRDPILVRQSTEQLNSYTQRSGGRFWANMGMWGMGFCDLSAGEASSAVRLIERGMSGFMATGARQHVPGAESLLAESYLALGSVDDALKHSTAGERMAHETQQYFYLPEVLRVKGRSLEAAGEPIEAEAAFKEALVAARKQGARNLELRIATNLAQILTNRSAKNEARALLEPVFRNAEEGIALYDYQNAHTMLSNLA
jgi:class 3 adenylate cyclase/tetratricopeptide (TPR) repeat protein